jgi:prolyl oligopeptidase
MGDPFAWLEEIHGARALEWARAQTARTVTLLESESCLRELEQQALAIATASDRLPWPYIDEPFIYNLRQDSTHLQGLLRRTSLASYISADPEWEDVLDLDALSAEEGIRWVFRGACREESGSTRCLLGLSAAGEDAVTYREFDLGTKRWVPDGFVLPSGRQSVCWIDDSNLYVARDWGDGTLTRAGYPFVIKALRRGQSLWDAEQIFAGEQLDVKAQATVLTDDAGHRVTIFSRETGCHEALHFLLTSQGPRPIPLPPKSIVTGYLSNHLIVILHEPFTTADGTGFPAGSLISFDVTELCKIGKIRRAWLLFSGGPREAIQQALASRSRVLVMVTRNLKGQLLSCQFDGHEWVTTRIDLSDGATAQIVACSARADLAFARVTGFLCPDTLYMIDAHPASARPVKAVTPRFDVSGLAVSQHEATARDGTRIPYFQIGPKQPGPAGEAPTVVHAYGGFRVALLPDYAPFTGKLWLERGGTVVVANIRGGGEFGAAWHEAGIKTGRQVVFDDFYAVAEDLLRRGVTCPRRMGAIAASNGALMLCVALNQRPGLFRAMVIQSPLTDMLNCHRMLSGAAWMDEYGDPADPDIERFWRRLSPYQNLRAQGQDTIPLFITATNDDRVHPAHARKLAAKMQSFGLPFLYIETSSGGHVGATNLKEQASRAALEYAFLNHMLMQPRACEAIADGNLVNT